jgi:hypothetical protein
VVRVGEAAPGHGSRPVNRLPNPGTRVGVNFSKYPKMLSDR